MYVHVHEYAELHVQHVGLYAWDQGYVYHPCLLLFSIYMYILYLYFLGGTVVEAKGDEMTRCGCMYMYVSRKWGHDVFCLLLNVQKHVLLM